MSLVTCSHGIKWMLFDAIFMRFVRSERFSFRRGACLVALPLFWVGENHIRGELHPLRLSTKSIYVLSVYLAHFIKGYISPQPKGLASKLCGCAESPSNVSQLSTNDKPPSHMLAITRAYGKS